MTQGRLGGRRALVTGAGSGIGLATAVRFSREGARVACVDRNRDALSCAVHQLAGDVLELPADVSDEKEIERAVSNVVNSWGGLDVLVVNAGVQLFGQDGPIHELERAVWDATLAVNLTGAFLTAKYGVRAMLGSGGGSVIFTASATGILGMGVGFDAYSASKGGVLALSRVLAAEYAKDGIRVNSVVPGLTATPLIKQFTDDEEKTADTISRIPLGRAGTAEDLAGVMVFLASDDSAYATGGIFTVDGGITAV